MSTTFITITPALALRRIMDSDLNVFAMERINDLELYGDQFPGLTPTVDKLKTNQQDYSTALGNLHRGDKSSTTAKNIARAKLEKTLTLIADNAAEIADDDIQKFQLLNFPIKSKGVPAGILAAPKDFNVKIGSSSGSIECRFKGVINNHGYEVEVRNEEGKAVATASGSSSPVLVSELEPLKIYHVRCRAIGAKNIKGDWTAYVIVSVI
jgi:hypothetical protein